MDAPFEVTYEPPSMVPFGQTIVVTFSIRNKAYSAENLLFHMKTHADFMITGNLNIALQVCLYYFCCCDVVDLAIKKKKINNNSVVATITYVVLQFDITNVNNLLLVFINLFFLYMIIGYASK